MTVDEILALPAGRELDALVAEKVMGWIKDKAYYLAPADAQVEHLTGGLYRMPYFSTDIAAAWQVVEKLRATGRECIVASAEGGRWEVEFYGDGFPCGMHVAGTAPLAVCRAALIATRAVPAALGEGKP